MGFIEETLNKTKEVLDDAGKKTGEIINVQKMRLDASSLSTRINKAYELLGRYYYNSKVNDQTDEAAIDLTIDDIKEKQVQLAEMRAEIDKARGKKLCEACGMANHASAIYCNNCGKKL